MSLKRVCDRCGISESIKEEDKATIKHFEIFSHRSSIFCYDFCNSCKEGLLLNMSEYIANYSKYKEGNK